MVLSRMLKIMADKACDVTALRGAVHAVSRGDCGPPLNRRTTGNPAEIPFSAPVCKAGLALHRRRQIR